MSLRTSAKVRLNVLRPRRVWSVSTSWHVVQGQVQRFIIFGSYVTAQSDPRDVDIFLAMRDDFQPSRAAPEAQVLFRHDTAQSEFGASIFWVNAGTSFADAEDLIIGWQTRRDLQRRGIVEVIEHDWE